MHGLHLKRQASGFRVEQLSLPVTHLNGPIDAEEYRRRARGEGPLMVHAVFPAAGVRAVTAQNDASDICDLAGPILNFVISGLVQIAADDTLIEMGPGSLFLVDEGEGRSQAIRPQSGCHLIQLSIGEEWPAAVSGDRSTVVIPSRPSSQVRPTHNLKRMYRAVDDRSRFRPFDTLFASETSASTLRPIIGFRFIVFPDQAFIDWHPEVVNCLVIVLSGELELEVGGDGGQVEQFCAGDVCLAEDRTGEGHIDRIRGVTAVAVIVMEDEHLWEV